MLQLVTHLVITTLVLTTSINYNKTNFKMLCCDTLYWKIVL